MAEETVKQGTNGQTAGTQEQTAAQAAGRTFTQAEVDAIVGDRLARERAKYADYETLKDKADKFDAQTEAEKTELQKAQDAANRYKADLENLRKANAARDARDKVAAETGVPATLLTANTEEECRTLAKAILDFRGKQPNYPATSDAGEVHTGTGGGKTRDSFANWFSDALGNQ